MTYFRSLLSFPWPGLFGAKGIDDSSLWVRDVYSRYNYIKDADVIKHLIIHSLSFWILGVKLFWYGLVIINRYISPKCNSIDILSKLEIRVEVDWWSLHLLWMGY